MFFQSRATHNMEDMSPGEVMIVVNGRPRDRLPHSILKNTVGYKQVKCEGMDSNHFFLAKLAHIRIKNDWCWETVQWAKCLLGKHGVMSSIPQNLYEARSDKATCLYS